MRKTEGIALISLTLLDILRRLKDDQPVKILNSKGQRIMIADPKALLDVGEGYCHDICHRTIVDENGISIEDKILEKSVIVIKVNEVGE